MQHQKPDSNPVLAQRNRRMSAEAKMRRDIALGRHSLTLKRESSCRSSKM